LEFYNGLFALCDDHFLPLEGFLDEPVKVGLGFMDGDCHAK
jgi:hypothetical protein